MGLKPLRNNFFIFLEPEKNRIFSRKYRIFSIFRQKIDDFLSIFVLPIFFVKIISMQPKNRYFIDKSVEKSDFLSINRSKKIRFFFHWLYLIDMAFRWIHDVDPSDTSVFVLQNMHISHLVDTEQVRILLIINYY